MLTDDEKRRVIGDDELDKIISKCYGDRLLSERQLWKLIYQAGAEAEREACADVCDNHQDQVDRATLQSKNMAKMCANAIRARNNS